MVDAKVGGRICNVSSQAGKKGFPMLGPYCAATAGVILLTQGMAAEPGTSGISVNAVCTGTVDPQPAAPTAMSARLRATTHAALATTHSTHPLVRPTTPPRSPPAPRRR